MEPRSSTWCVPSAPAECPRVRNRTCRLSRTAMRRCLVWLRRLFSMRAETWLVGTLKAYVEESVDEVLVFASVTITRTDHLDSAVQLDGFWNASSILVDLETETRSHFCAVCHTIAA